METAIQSYEAEYRELDSPLTVNDIKAQVELIQEVMRAVMKEGTHFGVIPGCGDKPTLFKAGAEKILTTFRICMKPLVEDLSTEDEVRYRIVCEAYTPSGKFLGAGVGECSSGEEKYRWRRASCDEEFEETEESFRRQKWMRSRKGDNWKAKQIRTQPADLANTVLKMAKKRAMVDMTLTVTAASDIFTQDLEEISIPNGNGGGGGGNSSQENASRPQRRSEEEQAPAIDTVEDLASRELPGGETKYGIALSRYGWFTSFDESHYKTAELAKSEGLKVCILYAKRGQFRHVTSLRLEGIDGPVY